MKKISLLNVFVAACVLAMSMAFSGCSKDSDDGDNTTTEQGIHKIELSLSESAYKDFSTKIVFNAFKKGSSQAYATIYDENGKNYMPIYDVDYKGGTTIATTEKNCFEFAASIMFSNLDLKAGSVTIKAKSYIDGKLIVSDSRTISFRDGDLSKAAYFNSQSGFTDLYL